MPKHLDNIFQKSFDKLEGPVGPEAWERLLPHLPSQKKRRLSIPFLIGVSLAILLSLPLPINDSPSYLGNSILPLNSLKETPMVSSLPKPIYLPKPSVKSQNKPFDTLTVVPTVQTVRHSLARLELKKSFSPNILVSNHNLLDSLSIKALSLSFHYLSKSLLRQIQPTINEQISKPWRFHVSLGSRWLYQNLWPNQQDQIIITNFQPVPPLSLDRLSGSLELGISKVWKKNFSWEVSLFMAHFQHALFFDQISYGAYGAAEDLNSPNGKISLTPKPSVQNGVSLNFSGWALGGGLKAAWMPDRHRLSLGVRYTGQYVNLIVENQPIDYSPALSGGRWQTLIQYDYHLVDFSKSWGLSVGPELGYTLGIRRPKKLSLGVQPYWWGIRLTISKGIETASKRLIKKKRVF
ncbi:MAG: hypothetical protein AAF696_16335 [Bacteroidota bacterium]